MILENVIESIVGRMPIEFDALLGMTIGLIWVIA